MSDSAGVLRTPISTEDDIESAGQWLENQLSDESRFHDTSLVEISIEREEDPDA